MDRERIARIAVITAILAVPAAALAAGAISGGAEGGCLLSWCAGLFTCGG